MARSSLSTSLVALFFAMGGLGLGCASTDAGPGQEGVCGDGQVDAGEPCDDGNQEDGDGCSAECEEEEGGRDLAESEELNAYVDELGKLETPEETPAETLEETPEQSSESPSGEPLTCSSQTLHEVKLFDSFTSQGAVAGRIYPGALLDGSSLANGLFNEVPLPRKPLTISANLEQANTSAVMETPSRSEFLAAQSAILLQGIPAGEQDTPQNLIREELSTQNADELSLQLGFNVNGGVVSQIDVAGQFNFNDTTKRSRYLVRIVDEFYTVAVDKPAFASDFLADSVTLSEFQSAFGPGQIPVYVDSVTYGRAIYIAVESTFSASELQAALNAALNGVAVDTELSFGITTKQVFEEISLKGIAVGPTEEDIRDLGNLKDPATILALKQRQVGASQGNFGQPISFTVAYLMDNTTTVSPVEGTYERETCELDTIDDFGVQVSQMNVTAVGDGADNTAEIRGSIAVSFGGNRVFLFNRAAGQEVEFTVGPVPGSSSFFKSGTLSDVDLKAGNTVVVELNLVEDDAGNEDNVFNRNLTIPVENLLDGEERITFNGAGIQAELVIGFEQLLD